VLELMTDRARELAAACPPRIYDHSEKPKRAGQFHRHVQAGAHTLATVPLDDIHQAVGFIDAFDETKEGSRLLRSAGDGGCQSGRFRTNPRDRHRLGVESRAANEYREPRDSRSGG
jgi:hypothetical protein